jgi:hypothetical protein
MRRAAQGSTDVEESSPVAGHGAPSQLPSDPRRGRLHGQYFLSADRNTNVRIHSNDWRDSMRTTQKVTTNHGGSYIGRTPRTVEFGRHKIAVRNWTDALHKMCARIAEDHPKEFPLVLSRITAARDLPYFMRTDDTDMSRRWHLIYGTGIYVRCNLSANNIAELCKALSRLFEYGPCTVELY